MTLVLIVLLAFLAVNLLGAVVATRVIAAAIAEQFPPTGRFVTAGKGRLHCHDLPARSAKPGLPVLLLHGATSNARDILDALGEGLALEHRVLAFDRPGHGWSDRIEGRAAAAPAVQARLIAEALGRLETGPVVVVGHSLAGSVATRLALDHKDCVAGLVLVAGATHPWPGGVNWYYRLAAGPVLGRLFVHTVMTPIGAFGLKASIASSFLPHRAPADYATRAAAALVLRPQEFRWNAQDVVDLKANLVPQARRYGEIAVPTAVLASDEDTVVSTGIHSRPLATAVPGARLTVLEGFGHQVHYNARDTVLAEIERVAAAAAARNDA